MGSDLLRKFQEKKLPFVEKGEELELNLGLSLGGCFGGKPKESSLYRSSSNACTATFWRDGDDGVDLSLTRTSSLPAASLQETKKRKGLMDVIQMEVMKKELEMKRCCRGGNGVEAAVLGINGSQGSGSSGITELESQSAQAQAALNQNVTCQKNHTESSSPTSVLSSPEQPNVNTMCPKPIKISDIKTEPKTDNRKAKLKNSCTRALDKNPTGIHPTDEMPHVFTRGDGPNGKRVEGFLFKYKKGEEVRIVCVCHGIFLTPAEFVKHAGGEELAHPLKRIVVVPSPSSLL